MSNYNFSIGVLSWKGYDSLRNSLSTYENHGLSCLTKEKFVCLPEYTQAGINICKEFNYKPVLLKKNLGILYGFKELAKRMPNGPLLLLENDLPLIEEKEETKRQINISLKYLKTIRPAQIRLRSKKKPGDPFVALDKYKKYWNNSSLSYIRRLFRPLKATQLIGNSVYVNENPELKHKQYVQRLHHNNFYCVTSECANWSNLGILVDKSFFLNIIIKKAENTKSNRLINGFKNIEIELNSDRWWQKEKFKVIFTPGLFTHLRLSNRGY